MKTQDALAKLEKLEPQTTLELMEGVTLRMTQNGIPVTRFHYTAIPERRTPEWKAKARKDYTSQAAWDREQEIIDNAGGGELVFADTLVTHWKKIVITDPTWRPDPLWRVEGGFDHGKTNATSLNRCYIDFDGTLILCGEYYMPGLEVWEHAPTIKKMEDVRKLAATYADPSIFPETMQQSQGGKGKPQERAKSINDLYVEQGIELFSPFAGDRSDVSFAARVMLHWANLEEREPSLKIVCPNYVEKPQPGLHNWSCPNLIWELMRTRRVKLTAQQLLSRNVAEAIVDKDNHARDAMKYIIMSHPEPTMKSARQLAADAAKPMAEAGDLTSAMIRYQQTLDQMESDDSAPIVLGKRRRR
jgi:hypothetical protein